MKRCSCALRKLGLECKLRQEFGGSPGGKAVVGSQGEGEGSKGDSANALFVSAAHALRGRLRLSFCLGDLEHIYF